MVKKIILTTGEESQHLTLFSLRGEREEEMGKFTILSIFILPLLTVACGESDLSDLVAKVSVDTDGVPFVIWANGQHGTSEDHGEKHGAAFGILAGEVTEVRLLPAEDTRFRFVQPLGLADSPTNPVLITPASRNGGTIFEGGEEVRWHVTSKEGFEASFRALLATDDW